jgi:acyl-CoA synthetase (AMP-forming)/AMP-acid ligase II
MSKTTTAPETFVDLLCLRAEQRPNDVAYRFFPQGVSNPLTLSYGELWTEAAALAYKFVCSGLEGERIVLATTSNRHFLTAFYACLMAGATATPAPPSGRKRQAERLRLLVADSEAKAMIADEDEVVSYVDISSVLKFDSRVAVSDEDKVNMAQLWRRPSLDDDPLALLQYTSGSTGDPKGVMVSHGNLMANSRYIQLAANVSEQSRFQISLPLFHDMGLIAGMLLPMYSGCESNLLTPVQFVQHPEWWLQLISNFKITHSGGPNFMFDLATKAITREQLKEVDLSCWEVAWLGAEPIRAATLAIFNRRFVDYGFRDSSFFPCYGMAETTLVVTAVEAQHPPALDHTRGVTPVVSCGFSRIGMQFEIVDPETRLRINDGLEGEIWVKGDSVAKGYWNRPELDKNVFRAFLADTGDGPFLRTGDLGYRKSGELYVTGRLKDLIIIRGKNYAPQDIEYEAEHSCDSILPNGCVAFSVDRNGSECLIIVVELRRVALRCAEEHQRVCRAVCAAVFDAFNLSVGEVVLVLPNAIPRTSSGKVKRSQCRLDYIEKRLGVAPQLLPQ